MQWRNEINTHTTGMKVLVWHGSTRETNHDELKKYDVVRSVPNLLLFCRNVDRWNRLSQRTPLWRGGNLFPPCCTVFLIISSSCFRKQEQGFKRKGVLVKEDSPVHRIHWNRIILDEAHNIKERSTNTAKAAFELKGNYRWCLSGTPLQNRVGELYSLVRFLGGDPFAYYFCELSLSSPTRNYC